MERLAIIADNLVGANDAGVQFRKFGFTTQVVLNQLDLVNQREGADVIAISTNSRTVSTEDAYKLVYQAGNRLLELGFQRFYKKIDSTLRGNIAEEIQAMLDALTLSLAVIAPSYPVHGRVVENGYLQLVKEWGDSSVPVPICYIPSVVKTVPGMPVAVIGLTDVRQGEKKLVQKIAGLHAAGIRLITVDAVTDADLRIIAVAINKLTVPCLAVGSAGLAGNLPIAWKAVDQEHLGLREGSMIIAGTLNQVTSEQITEVLAYPGTELIDIAAAAVYEGRVDEEYIRVMSAIAASLASGRIPVIATDTLLKNRNTMDALSLSVQVHKHGPAVTALLGQIARETAEKHGLRNLVIAGGGTATSICHMLEISIIDLERELLPGVPVGKAVGGSCSGLYLITKAGGFGRRDSLQKVLELL